MTNTIQKIASYGQIFVRCVGLSSTPQHERALAAWIIVAVLTSSHVIIFDLLGLRLHVQIAAVLMLVALGAPILLRVRPAMPYNLLALAALTHLFGEVLTRGSLTKMLGLGMGLYLSLIIQHGGDTLRLRILKGLVAMFAVWSVMAFFQFILVYFDRSLAVGIKFSNVENYYSMDFHVSHWSMLLGSRDSFYTVFGESMPRLSSFLTQASLFPAYFMIPAALAMAYAGWMRRAAWTVLLFCILSLGGNVIVAFASGIAVYLFVSKLSRWVLVWLPFVCLVMYAFICYYVAGTREYWHPFLIEVSISQHGEILGYVADRLLSGLIRMELLAAAVLDAISAMPLGSREVSDTFSSWIVTSTIKAGIPGLVVGLWLFYTLFNLLEKAIRQNSCDRHPKFGLSLLYAVLLQAMVYNDFGLTTFWGYFILTMVLVHLTEYRLDRKPIHDAPQIGS